ncbi:MAG: sensor histidine kinase, partial [Clostridia bacterium]
QGMTILLRTPRSYMLDAMQERLTGLVILLVLFVLSILLITRFLVMSIREPMDKLMDMCVRIRGEDFSPAADEGARDEMHSLIESFNLMTAHIQRLIEEVYRKNMVQAQTEMQLLRSQINPHFVYNTLETIRASALEQGNATLAQMTSLLGKTLRYGVSAQSEPVLVREEIAHLRDYLELQQMHFSGRLQVTVSVEPEIENCSMMKLILQPLVENAIYHGMSMTEGRGQIRVLGFAEGETLVFQVSDDGIGIAPEELALLTGYINGQNDAFTSIGLKNTNRRIKLYYNEEHGLAIRSVLGAGTSITVRIPRVGGESTCDPC